MPVSPNGTAVSKSTRWTAPHSSKRTLRGWRSRYRMRRRCADERTHLILPSYAPLGSGSRQNERGSATSVSGHAQQGAWVGSGEGIMTKLAAVLFQIDAGSISLPAFQRDYNWNPDQ